MAQETGMAQSDEPRRWLAVRNLTAQYHTIAPDDPDRRGKDITIPPYDTLTVAAAEWEDDLNLATAVSAGRLAVEIVTRKVKRIPERPAEANLNQKALNNMVDEIVFGKPDTALAIINSEVRFLDRAGQPVDVAWLKGTMLRVLAAARAWLVVWGPPADFTWRIEAIDKRDQAIRQMA